MLEELYKDINDRMEKALVALKHEFGKVRTGRASTALLDTIRVDYYGNPTPLTQMATVSAPEPRLLVIQPWDISSLHAIEKAIQASELGLNPQNDGKIVRIPIPPLTEERRKDLVKLVNKFAEEGRVAIRNARHHGMEELKKGEKDRKISQDDLKRGQTRIQQLTDDHVKKIEALVAAKSKEILEV
jgi:ribosome recycling factor